MMRKAIAAVTASMLALSAHSQAAEVAPGDNWHLSDKFARYSSTQSHMFDGISLTEHQRQQMRDLMQQARQKLVPVDVTELEKMHLLVIAENFDETAVRAQARKIAEKQVSCQVEMARIRNQMYHLLTPEQQAVLNKKHQQQLDHLREAAQMQQNSSLGLFSSSTRSTQ